jgi:cold-inducible RNA-binding protein
MAQNSRPTFSKGQREADQKSRVAQRAARRDDRKARAAHRAAQGHVGPPMGEPMAPLTSDEFAPPAREEGANDAGARPSARDAMGSRLYVGNLSFTTDADAIRELFTTVGEVSDVYLVMDRDTGRPRGFAFVTMATGAAAKKAVAELDGAALDNRQLRVNVAEERQTRGGGGGGGGRGRY